MNKKEQNAQGRNRIIVGVVVAIFIFSSFAVILNSNDNTNTDTGKITLNLSNGIYTFNMIQDTTGAVSYDVSSKTQKFTVYTLPQQLGSIDMDARSYQILKDYAYFYIAFDPEDENLAPIDFIRFDLRTSLPQDHYFIDAVTNESLTYVLPRADCTNATSQIPVIILKTSNMTKITEKDNCVTMQFIQYDTLKIRDMFVYLSRGIDIK
jgi:hypothetical protein